MSEVKIKLTTLQGEILSHRLEVPDAISEVLEAESDGDPRFRRRMYRCKFDVEKIAEEMLETIAESGYIDIGKAGFFRRWLAVELLEGSTFFACSSAAATDDEMSGIELANLRRSLEALEKKFEAHGERIKTPTW